MNSAVVHTFDAPPRDAQFSEQTAGGDEVIVFLSAAGRHPIVKALVSGTDYGSARELPIVPRAVGVGRLVDYQMKPKIAPLREWKV